MLHRTSATARRHLFKNIDKRSARYDFKFVHNIDKRSARYDFKFAHRYSPDLNPIENVWPWAEERHHFKSFIQEIGICNPP